MSKWVFLSLCLLAMPVWAETSVDDEEIDLLAPEPEIEKIVPIKFELPTCQDERVLQQVQMLLKQYNQEHPVNSIYEKRQRALQMRYTAEYDEEKVTNFTAKQNREVADKLLMTKINNGLDDNEIRLCKSKTAGTDFQPIYIMMYNNHQNETELHLLNFLKNTSEELKTSL
ncbi:MAG: hypothetical protein IJ660_07000 [Alphaproteobacteria bacterium]|nr:hypothetical protein [Alphaproteobacteria bacterium]